MDIPSNIKPLWDEYVASTDADVSSRFYEACQFGDSESMVNSLAELVLAGTKRATASLLMAYEVENNPLPVSGAISVVTNWANEPVCIIESTIIEVIPFNEVTQEFATAEGEGDKSLRFWKDAHWDFFGRECKRIGKEPSPEMLVVCEQFEVVYPTSESG